MNIEIMFTVTAPLIAVDDNQKIFLAYQVQPLLESGLYSRNIILTGLSSLVSIKITQRSEKIAYKP